MQQDYWNYWSRLSTSLLAAIVLLPSAACIAFPHPSVPNAKRNHGAFQKPSKAQVSHAIGLAAGYMQRACGPDGRFVYKVDTDTGNESHSYNIIRHAGAIYALGLLLQAHPSTQTRAAMLRAAGYLRQNYVAPGPSPGMLVVWSKPITEHSDAELGATGLGLVALSAARRQNPDAVPLKDLQALGRFILFLQRPNGSFFSKYSLATGPVEGFQSLYYPGEAALGLLALYELDHSQVWLTAAANALHYLAHSREGMAELPADHWSLIATAKLLALCNEVQLPASRAELLRHSSGICEAILGEQVHFDSSEDLDGSFDKNGRTAPTATRLEGLLATLEFLPKGDLHSRIDVATAHGIAFLLRAQTMSGTFAGGMPGAYSSLLPSAAQIRIDYVQHALVAWLRYK